jgi:hypothetical protein
MFQLRTGMTSTSWIPKSGSGRTGGDTLSATRPPQGPEVALSVESFQNRNQNLQEKELPMIAQIQIKGRGRQASARRTQNGLTTASPSSRALQPAVIPRKAPVSLSTVTEGPSPAHEQIAIRAYQLWEVNERPDGTDVEDWLLAEALLRTEA